MMISFMTFELCTKEFMYYLTFIIKYFVIYYLVMKGG